MYKIQPFGGKPLDDPSSTATTSNNGPVAYASSCARKASSMGVTVFTLDAYYGSGDGRRRFCFFESVYWVVLVGTSRNGCGVFYDILFSFVILIMNIIFAFVLFHHLLLLLPLLLFFFFFFLSILSLHRRTVQFSATILKSRSFQLSFATIVLLATGLTIQVDRA